MTCSGKKIKVDKGNGNGSSSSDTGKTDHLGLRKSKLSEEELNLSATKMKGKKEKSVKQVIMESEKISSHSDNQNICMKRTRMDARSFRSLFKHQRRSDAILPGNLHTDGGAKYSHSKNVHSLADEPIAALPEADILKASINGCAISEAVDETESLPERCSTATENFPDLDRVGSPKVLT